MNDCILIQHIHADTPGVKMLELTRAHHAAYCERWNMDYRPIIGNPVPHIPPGAGNWAKIELIRQALDEGYQYVAWLDADALIIDFETDLREAMQPNRIGACWHRIPQLDHWNVGVLYIHNSTGTREFIYQWLTSYPPPPDGWMEQGVFNRMARESNIVTTISDRWNATIDVSMVPDAVVLGFHGQGNTEYRYKEMQETMEALFQRLQS